MSRPNPSNKYDYDQTKMIEVFKTNVQNEIQCKQKLKTLKKKFPALKINFDLQDCDKIVRVEGKNISGKRNHSHIEIRKISMRNPCMILTAHF